MSKQMRILVLGAGGSPGINFIRALRLASDNLYIVGTDINKFYLELTAADKKYLLSYTKGQEEAYVKQLVTIIKNEHIDFVHAQPDREVKILSDYRTRLGAKTLLPSQRAIDICQDKWASTQEWKKHHVPVPRAYKVVNRERLQKLLKNNKDILWIRASRGAGGKASLQVKTYIEAKVWIEYWVARGLTWHDFLLSELLPGKEVSWLSVWKNGKLICSQQKERYEWVQANISPSGVGGTTAIQRTTHYPKVNEVATKAVLAVDKSPNGIYVVDTKENKEGVPCVTEINPGRFFTTSLFFATAGVNIPFIYLNLGLGLSIPKVKQYDAVEENIFWIRVPDGGPVMVKNDAWTSISI